MPGQPLDKRGFGVNRIKSMQQQDRPPDPAAQDLEFDTVHDKPTDFGLAFHCNPSATLFLGGQAL